VLGLFHLLSEYIFTQGYAGYRRGFQALVGRGGQVPGLGAGLPTQGSFLGLLNTRKPEGCAIRRYSGLARAPLFADTDDLKVVRFFRALREHGLPRYVHLRSLVKGQLPRKTSIRRSHTVRDGVRRSRPRVAGSRAGRSDARASHAVTLAVTPQDRQGKASSDNNLLCQQSVAAPPDQ
jgi:hypothetical protein